MAEKWGSKFLPRLRSNPCASPYSIVFELRYVIVLFSRSNTIRSSIHFEGECFLDSIIFNSILSAVGFDVLVLSGMTLTQCGVDDQLSLLRSATLQITNNSLSNPFYSLVSHLIFFPLSKSNQTPKTCSPKRGIPALGDPYS